MPLNDDRLRPPPYVRIFPDPAARDRLLDAIASEVTERGMGDEDPGAFAMLEQTGRAMAELRDPGTEDDGGPTHALLLFHAFHLRNAGGEHLLARIPVCRWAVEGRDAGGGEPTDADPLGFPSAVYVQLPQHLFWVRDAGGERPLSLDGFFWTVRGDTLHLLGVMDVLSPEGGLRVLPLPGVPVRDRGTWLSLAMRESGEDFRSEIPGSELEGLYELRTAGELLKLAARLDLFTARFPDAREPIPPAEGEGDAAAGIRVHRLTIV